MVYQGRAVHNILYTVVVWEISYSPLEEVEGKQTLRIHKLINQLINQLIN